MKILGKWFNLLLRKLQTDANTFFTYILTLLSIYFIVDRVVEMLFMIFTGVSVSYWGPFLYTFALACPVFAFAFSGSSKFASSKNIKIKLFYLYCISLYIIGISMLIQWINLIGWLAFFSVPNFTSIASQFPELIKPAFSAIAVYIPLMTFYTLFSWLFSTINDSKQFTESLTDYSGIKIGSKKENTGIYSTEMVVCTDAMTGKPIVSSESSRFESTLVVGSSGTGKTSMVFEPMVAKDLEKKFFFREVSKEMGFTALKTGIAYLKTPYNNEYLNNNFNLNMLAPSLGKENIYRAYMKKMILGTFENNTIYKNLGITSVSPDFESISHMIEIANNYKIPYTLIDPESSNSVGLNPFTKEDPAQTAIIISSILRGMYTTVSDETESFMMNFANQAIENLSILLKEMYPRLNNGLLPTLEDMLNMFNDFTLIEELCNELIKDEELKQKYSLQLSYFKKNFFKDGVNLVKSEEYIMAASTQLDNLLRYPGVKRILCNRNNNINFDEMLANGEVVFLCTRRGALGGVAHKAFGLFFLLLMQYSVLGRPGNEQTRIANFLYIDEFPNFITKATEPIFTTYRKYRCATIVSSQTLAQLEAVDGENYRKTIIANSKTKIVFGDNSPEENTWWGEEFGQHRRWKYNQDFDTETGKYKSELKGVVWGWKDNVAPGRLQALKFKECAYKIKSPNGRFAAGIGMLDFIEDKHKESKKLKVYQFDKYINGVVDKNNKKDSKKNKFDPSNVTFENNNPIQTDSTDSSLFLNNGNSISFNFNKDKDKK